MKSRKISEYKKYRGMCKTLSEEECKKNTNFKLMKGWYYCPIWNSEEQHYWCEDEKGNIIDPSKLQFPSKGQGKYKKYKGVFPCSSCKTDIKESDIDKNLVQGKYIFCSGECYGKFING